MMAAKWFQNLWKSDTFFLLFQQTEQWGRYWYRGKLKNEKEIDGLTSILFHFLKIKQPSNISLKNMPSGHV